MSIINSFEDLNLSDELLRGIYSYGWEIPSIVQQKGITPVIEGKDSIIQAQSGTGKTGTFSISVLHRINVKIISCQAIILSPTREIALQSSNVIKKLGAYIKNINISTVIGGINLINEIVLKSHIVVGTPGRVKDMIGRGYINMSKLCLFVLDESDQMLNIGFKEQIIDILEYIPPKCQIAIYSATMPMSIIELADRFMKNPTKILVKKEQLTLDGISQFHIACSSEQEKFNILCDIYHTLKIAQSIIYCVTKRKVEWLSTQLENSDFPVSRIHSNMTQTERQDIIKNFRSGINRILITTDLLARGVDFPQVSLVINYDLPNTKQNYIHRIGRTGRYGKKGVAINLIVSDKDHKYMKELEEFYKTEITEMPQNIQNYIS